MSKSPQARPGGRSGRRKSPPLRVLHAPLNFANQAYVISQALREHGVDSEVLTYAWGKVKSSFKFDVDTAAHIRFTHWITDEFEVLQRVLASDRQIIHLWNRSLLYAMGDTVFNGLDLPFLRAAGKRIAYRFTGYELRRKSLELEVNPYSPFRYGFESRHNEQAQQQYVDYLRGYVDRFIVQDPEMQGYLAEATIIPRALPLDKFAYIPPRKTDTPLIVHAPTDRVLKGSDFLFKAIDTLRERRGLTFEFKTIEGMPHEEALAWYRKADIVVDQLLIGWYGVLAMEAMAMGKAVIAYVRDDLVHTLGDETPLLIANPDTITDVLYEAITDAELRRQMGRRGRDYVRRTHCSRKVAAELEGVYREMMGRRRMPVRNPVLAYQQHAGEGTTDLINTGRRAKAKLLPELYAARVRMPILERELAAATTELEATRRRLAELEVSAGEAEAAMERLKAEALARKRRADQQRREEILALRAQAREHERLKKLIPTLRFKAKQWETLEAELPVLEAKAARYQERNASGRWRLMLPLTGVTAPRPQPLEPAETLPAQYVEGPIASHATVTTCDRARAAATAGSPAQGTDDAAGEPVTEVELDRLRSMAAAARTLREEAQALAAKAASYDAAKPHLAGLRYKAKQYDRLASSPLLRLGAWSLAMALAPLNVAARVRRVAPPSSPVLELAAAAGRGQQVERKSVCILSRKMLRNITRVPRQAQALVEAGFDVTVVALGAPVDELQAMTPEVEYLEVEVPLAKVWGLRRRLAQRVRESKARDKAREQKRATLVSRQKKDPSPRSSLRLAQTAVADGLGAIWRSPARLAKNVLVVAPSALFLKRGSQSYRGLFNELAGLHTLEIIGRYVVGIQQIAITRGFAREVEAVMEGRAIDIVQAHDNYALVAARRLARRHGAKLIYDAVEISSHRLATDFNAFDRLRERFERWEEGRIFTRADAMITVSNGLADWYSTHYRVSRPLVVRNCRHYWEYEVDTRLREDCGVGDDVRLVAWFGGAYPQQGLELLVDVAPRLPEHIHIVIVATVLPRWKPFLASLSDKAAALGCGERVHVLDPREPNDLIPYMSGADIGIIPRPSEHLNIYYSMPNKFLEMVMARLPIAVSRVGDMVHLVRKYEMGEVFDERDAANVAAVLERMLEPQRYRTLRANVSVAAHELTWENESRPYVELVGRLAGRRLAAPADNRQPPAVEPTAAPDAVSERQRVEEVAAP